MSFTVQKLDELGSMSQKFSDNAEQLIHNLKSNQPVPQIVKPLLNDGTDGLVEKLNHCNIKVSQKFYNDNQMIYLSAITRRGDRFLLKLEENNIGCPKNLSSNDFKLNLTTGSIVPIETLNDSLRYYTDEIVGIAFLCNDSMCVAKPIETQVESHVKYQEEVYKLDGHKNHTFGNFGNSLVPYPVVSLNHFIKHPKKLECHINKINHDLYECLVQHLHQHQKELFTVLDKLHDQISGLSTLLKFLQDDSYLHQFEKLYTQICNVCVDDLDKTHQETYVTIVDTLKYHKDFRQRLMNNFHQTYTVLGNLHHISQSVSNIMDPMATEWHETCSN